MKDDFNDNSLDTNKWVESSASESLVEESDQKLKLISEASWSAFVYTKNKYKIQKKYIIIKVVSHSNDGGFKISTTYGNGAHWPQWDIYEEADYYNFQPISGPKVRVMKKKNGSASYPATSPVLNVPYWLKIRFDDSKIYFEYADVNSPTSSDWKILYSETFDLGTAITDEYYIFLTAYNTPSTGASHIDTFEISDYSRLKLILK